MTYQIERDGKTDGRHARYRLIVDGVDLGEVKRKTTRSPGRSFHDTWAIRGTECATQERAEALLIERAERFGYL